MSRDKDMEKLPEGWEKISLEKDAILISGLRPRGGASEEGIPSLGGEHITTDGRVNFSDENAKYIPEKFFGDNFKGRAEKNDILINKDGANAGKVAILKEKFHQNIAVNEHIFILRSKGLFDQKYLFYWLFSPWGQKQLKDRITGSAQPGLSSKFIKNFFVLTPPLSEQQKIAEILETVDNAIEKTEKIIEKYKRIKQGLMQELLTKGIDENGQIRSEKTHKFKDSPIGRIPEEWEVVRLGEEKVSKKIKAGGTPLRSQKEYYEDGSIPFARIEDIVRSEKYLYDTELKITEKGLKNSAAWIVPINSLMISMYASYGEIAINKIPVATNQAILAIVPNEGIEVEYLYYILKALKTKLSEHIRETTQKNLNASIIKNIAIPLPPLSEQQRIASILSQIDEVIEKETAYKEKLKRLKNGLMEDLLTGKVRVNNLLKGEI